MTVSCVHYYIPAAGIARTFQLSNPFEVGRYRPFHKIKPVFDKYYLVKNLKSFNYIACEYAKLEGRKIRQCDFHSEIHRKKRVRCFPFPRRDVTYQTLSRREYVSLIKPEVFPFPSLDSHRILLNQLVFLFTYRSFPGYSTSPGGNSSKVFDNSFVYLFPVWV